MTQKPLHIIEYRNLNEAVTISDTRMSSVCSVRAATKLLLAHQERKESHLFVGTNFS